MTKRRLTIAVLLLIILSITAAGCTGGQNTVKSEAGSSAGSQGYNVSKL